MDRQYKNVMNVDNAMYFTGTEIENTPTTGLNTLFVVGLRPIDEIVQLALANEITAIYFGANQSFGLPMPDDYDEWEPWVKMIRGVLDDPALFWCTLDFDLKYMESFLETGLAENNRMIPMVSVKMPYIVQLGYNAVIKIDDIDFNRTNPGVWCHSIQNVMHPSVFTHWQKYNDDKLIKGTSGQYK